MSVKGHTKLIDLYRGDPRAVWYRS